MRATAALAVLACSTPSFAEVPPALAAQARAAVDADTPRLTAMFKDIHQNPELGFMETRTAAIVATELKALGFTVTTGIGGIAGAAARERADDRYEKCLDERGDYYKCDRRRNRDERDARRAARRSAVVVGNIAREIVRD